MHKHQYGEDGLPVRKIFPDTEQQLPQEIFDYIKTLIIEKINE